MKQPETPYSLLSDQQIQSNLNFYGIIYDASLPILESSSSIIPNTTSPPFYECIIKLLDPSMILTNSFDITNSIFTLSIKSPMKECLPLIHSIGDIIRIHNGLYIPMQKTVYMQLTSVTKLISNWCLFSAFPNNEHQVYTPLQCSNTNYLYEDQDTQNLNALRKYIHQTFQIRNSLSYPNTIKLKAKSQYSTYDCTVEIISKSEYMNDVVYIVQDDTERCELKTVKYFSFLEVNNVIRMTNVHMNSRNQIVVGNESNILLIPALSDYYKMFIRMIEDNKVFLDMKFNLDNFINHYDDNDMMKLSNVNLLMENNMEMVIENTISHSKDIISLIDNEELPLRAIDSITQPGIYLMEIHIEEIFPVPIENISNIICDQCHNTFLTKEVIMNEEAKFNCPSCGIITKGNIHFNAYMKCIERQSNKPIILHLCTYDNEGDMFFGIKPRDFLNNPSELQKLSLRVKELTSSKSSSSFITIKVNVINIPSNTSPNKLYRIIGKYTTNYTNSLI